MSDEEETSVTEEVEAQEPVSEAPKESTSSEKSPAKTETKESLREKFRLTKDEEILRDIKPSIFAFIPMYILALAILGIHLLFDWGTTLDTGNNGTVETILIWLLEIGTVGEIGFVMLMFLLTWWNRMMNGATSGKWSTSLLMIITFTPLVLRFDDVIATLFTDRTTGWIPLNEFHYTFFGVMWSAVFVLATLFYQRSFHYAITNHRVIYTQHLFIAGDGRRILFDNISEIRTQRTTLGALLGFNTIITDTGNQLDIGEETMGVSGGSASSGGGDGSIEGQITKSIFKRFFVFLTYQRSRKVDLPDPRHCFYCISNWKDIEQLLNEMHQRHSSSGMLTDLKEQLLSEKN